MHNHFFLSRERQTPVALDILYRQTYQPFIYFRSLSLSERKEEADLVSGCISQAQFLIILLLITPIFINFFLCRMQRAKEGEPLSL